MALPINSKHLHVDQIRKKMEEGDPPSSAQEYLLRVRLEADEIPDIVISDINPREYDNAQTPNMPNFDAVKEHFHEPHPNEKWKTNAISNFVELRQYLARMENTSLPSHLNKIIVPPLSDIDGWKFFCYGCPHQEDEITEETINDASSDTNIDSIENQALSKIDHKPTLQLLLQFDQVVIRRLLSHHLTWLEDEPFSADIVLWIYALLARLDKPVSADVASQLRRLLRNCCEPKKIVSLEDIHYCNLLICIIGDVFNQFDK